MIVIMFMHLVDVVHDKDVVWLVDVNNGNVVGPDDVTIGTVFGRDDGSVCVGVGIRCRAVDTVIHDKSGREIGS